MSSLGSGAELLEASRPGGRRKLEAGSAHEQLRGKDTTRVERDGHYFFLLLRGILVEEGSSRTEGGTHL